MSRIYGSIKTLSLSRPKGFEENDSQSSSVEKGGPFVHKTRFVVLVLSTLCLSSLQSNVLTLNFTVICMAGNENGTSEERRYNYDAGQKSTLFSIVAVGAIAAVVPMMRLVYRFGTRSVTTAFGLVSAASTALVPLFALWGYEWLLAIRFIQGTGLSIIFTLIAVLTRQWSMHKQSAFYIAFLTCLYQFGPIFTMPVSGALCTSSLGWQSTYYVHSGVCFVLFALFAYFYREFPSRHRLVSAVELGRIRREKGNTEGERDPVPYKAMLLSPAVWAVWAASVGNFMGIQITMQFTPTFLNVVMGFSVESTGVFACIPQVVTFFVKMLAGVLSDKSTACFNNTLSTKIFNHLAVGGMAVFFFIQGFITPSSPVLALACLVCSMSIIGFNCGAFFRGSALMAAQHNHFIMAVNSLINCVSALVAPVIVRALVAHDTFEEWRNVWFLFGALLTVMNLIYAIFGPAQPAEWTKPSTPENNTPRNWAEAPDKF